MVSRFAWCLLGASVVLAGCYGAFPERTEFGVGDVEVGDQGAADADAVADGTPIDPDAARPDGAVADAERAEVGPPDSGPPDSGPPDSGPPDSGPPDSGPPDADPGERCNGFDDDGDGAADEGTGRCVVTEAPLAVDVGSPYSVAPVVAGALESRWALTDAGGLQVYALDRVAAIPGDRVEIAGRPIARSGAAPQGGSALYTVHREIPEGMEDQRRLVLNERGRDGAVTLRFEPGIPIGEGTTYPGMIDVSPDGARIALVEETAGGGEGAIHIIQQDNRGRVSVPGTPTTRFISRVWFGPDVGGDGEADLVAWTRTAEGVSTLSYIPLPHVAPANWTTLDDPSVEALHGNAFGSRSAIGELLPGRTLVATSGQDAGGAAWLVVADYPSLEVLAAIEHPAGVGVGWAMAALPRGGFDRDLLVIGREAPSTVDVISLAEVDGDVVVGDSVSRDLLVGDELRMAVRPRSADGIWRVLFAGRGDGLETTYVQQVNVR